MLALAGLVILTGLHRQLSLETLFAHRAALERFVSDHWAAAFAIYIGLYLVFAGIAIPGSSVLTITGGALFGAGLATIGTVIGTTIGGTLVFLIARTAIGDFLLRRKDPRAAQLAEGFRRNAFYYLLFLRLVPFPFWLVNVTAALFEIPLRVFIAASALGVIPAAFAYASFGSGIDSIMAAEAAAFQKCLAAGRSDCQFAFDIRDAVTPQLITALVMLCVLALLPVAIKRFRARQSLEEG
jgi:uncharacterized membrane protein YdjX (TVP38/TMEM64 family)